MDSKTKVSAVMTGLTILLTAVVLALLAGLIMKASSEKAAPAPAPSPTAAAGRVVKGLMQFSSPVFGDGAMLVTEVEYMPYGSICVKSESLKTICVKVGTYVLIKE